MLHNNNKIKYHYKSDMYVIVDPNLISPLCGKGPLW